MRERRGRWAHEAALRGMEVCFGEPRPERALEQRLQLPAIDLEVGGEWEHVLNEYMVYERHTDLERVCHRQPIRERKDVVTEVGLVVEVQRRREASRRATVAVEAPEALPGGVPSDRVAKRRGIEPIPQRVGGAAQEAEVAVGRGARRSGAGAEGPLHPVHRELAPEGLGEQLADGGRRSAQRPR